MNSIEPPDKHHLLAAEGWLELGNELEAFKELDRIAPAFTAHPEVLRLRCRLYGKTRNWIAAVNAAKALCELDTGSSLMLDDLPPRFEGPIKTIFGDGRHSFESIKLSFYAIPYNLACYACQLGHLKEAWDWLMVAVDIADVNEIRMLALHDEDLEPLWDQIREL
ncbi:MAG: hypothetical protein O2960_30130 [Verrucomicrobia bacterium]|nr:hypothetical protein [Verrucomicrobiota bacterium]